MPRPILVTGAHRSGSTWVGNILASSKDIFYIHEPFNVGLNSGHSPLINMFEHLEGTSIIHQQKAKFYLKRIIP